MAVKGLNKHYAPARSKWHARHPREKRVYYIIPYLETMGRTFLIHRQFKWLLRAYSSEYVAYTDAIKLILNEVNR